MRYCYLIRTKIRCPDFNRLNRLASLLLSHVAPSTPTKGMEVIYNFMPLDILIEKRASETMARINYQIQPTWDGIGKGRKNGLIARWRSAAPKICNDIVKTDRIPTKIVREKCRDSKKNFCMMSFFVNPG